jgi:hypothetical protein
MIAKSMRRLLEKRSWLQPYLTEPGALLAAVKVQQEHVKRCSASLRNTWIQAGPSNKSPETWSGVG